MSADPKIERLIAMAERLIADLESDIAALKDGSPGAMRSMRGFAPPMRSGGTSSNWRRPGATRRHGFVSMPRGR